MMEIIPPEVRPKVDPKTQIPAPGEIQTIRMTTTALTWISVGMFITLVALLIAAML